MVKLFYRYCADQRYCENIGTGIKSSIKHKEYYKAALTRREASDLLESIDTTTLIGKRDKLIIALMLTNGLRACEVERIDISDFDMNRGRMVLNIQRKGKVDKRDMVALPPMIGELLEDDIGDRDFGADDPLIIRRASGGGGRRLAKVMMHAID